MSDLGLQNKAHAVCSKLFVPVAHLLTLVWDLRLQNKAHEVCTKLFLRVAQLCQYSTYVRSSITEQGTRRV